MTQIRHMAVLLSACLVASPVLACDTADDIIREARGERSKITVISETGALARALSFMIAKSDEVQPAETLIVIEGGLHSEVVLIQKGCATLKALSNRSLIAELLRHARGEEAPGELI